MQLGSKRPPDSRPEWTRPRAPRKMRLSDLTTDAEGKPLIGTPVGKRQIVLDGVLAREEFKMGKLIGWHDRSKTQPILEYPDGTREAVNSMGETNWRKI